MLGELDEKDNVPVERSIQRLREGLTPDANPHHVIRVFPGVGHTLTDPEGGWIREEILDYLGEWILEAMGGLDPSMHDP